MIHSSVPWQFWLTWCIGFLGFPLGGLLAKLLVGAVNSPATAALAGVVTGAVLGLVQWLILRQQSSLSIIWILATSVGMSIGLSLSVAVLGGEIDHNLLIRGLITGLMIGIAQAITLRFNLSLGDLKSTLWAVTTGFGFVVGWFITRSVGIDLSPQWSVFGASGALAFQIMTGTVMYFLLRSEQLT